MKGLGQIEWLGADVARGQIQLQPVGQRDRECQLRPAGPKHLVTFNRAVRERDDRMSWRCLRVRYAPCPLAYEAVVGLRGVRRMRCEPRPADGNSAADALAIGDAG